MRNITSLMFALDANQVTRLNHYVKNEEGKYDLANVCMSVPVTTRSEGRFECILENIDITCDALTKNIALTIHLVDKDGLREAMEKDDRIFTFDMKFSPRTNKMNFFIYYDGYQA